MEAATPRPPTFILLCLATLLATAGCSHPKDPTNPAELKERIQSKLKWALWKADATDDQRARFDALLDPLSVDLFAYQQESKAIKRRVMDALIAEPVDREALLKTHEASTDLFRRYMRRMLVAGGDAGTILTQAQRQELVDMWREWEFGD